ncbi:MAG: type I methionyl aminopeptidase [Parcubacteria group bacterium]
MIQIKNKKELELMAESGSILAGIIKELRNIAKPGMTTKELDRLASELVLFHEVKPAFLKYNGFPSTVCLSVNEELVHGVPSEKVLKEGDLLSIDMGVIYKEFYSDSATTFPVLGVMSYDEWKEKNPEAHKLISVTEESLYAGIKQAIVGNHIGDISTAVQTIVERNNFSIIRDLVGHGIGRDLHEDPPVPNFSKADKGPELQSGMVIAIEPMVAIGDRHIEVMSDGFTYKMKDNSLSAHFEHTVAITEKGPKILTKA